MAIKHYKLNSWDVHGVEYITPQPDVIPTADSEFIILNPDSNKTCYLSKTEGLGNTSTGNSLELVGSLPLFELECDGTQYITTAIKPTETTYISTTVYIDTEDTDFYTLFGTPQSSNSTGQFIFIYSGSGPSNIKYTYGNTEQIATYTFEKNGYYTITCKGKYVYINDKLVLTHKSDFSQGNDYLTLLKSLGSDERGFAGRIKEFIIETEDTSLHLEPILNTQVPQYIDQDNNLYPSDGEPFVSFIGPYDYNINNGVSFFLDDGVYRAELTIKRNALICNNNIIPIVNDCGSLHRYTVTMQSGNIIIYFDKKIVRTVDGKTSKNMGKFLGFLEGQNGVFPLYIKYLKDSKKCIKYFLPESINFELEIDFDKNFESENKKTYTKEDFFNIPDQKQAWDPVSLVCGSKESGLFDLSGLVYAATIQLPERQPNKSYEFFYRVRFISDNYTSDYSYSFLTHRERTISIPDQIVELPETPLADGADYVIHNNGTLPLHLYRYPYTDGFMLTQIEPYSIIKCTYDKARDIWNINTLYKQASYILPMNGTNAIFDAVFNKTIPYDGEVYTTDMNSGESANIIRAKASEEDNFIQTLTQQKRNLNTHLSDLDVHNTRWESVFDIDKSLFRNTAEERHAFQCMVENLKGQTLHDVIYNLIYDLTGCAPTITEYKDLTFNVIYSHNDSISIPTSDMYYLSDPETYSLVAKPFVLYDQKDRMPTWQIDVYNTLDSGYNRELIRNVIQLFKPAHTFVVLNFYDTEGVLITEHAYYGGANYVNGQYNI